MTSFERIERRKTVTTITTSVDDNAPETASHTAHSTQYRVIGAEAAPQYVGSSRLYVPTLVTVEHYDGEQPNVWVRGSQQRRDGSLSPNVQDLAPYTWDRDQWPAWLVEIVADAAAAAATA